MAKKRKNKSNKKQRREVEILRAQVKSGANISEKQEASIPENTKAKLEEIKFDPNDSFIKHDLIKTVVISAVLFAIIFGLWFTQ